MNGTNFKNKLLKINCLFFSLQLLSESFLILRRFQRDIIINVHWSSCKVPVIPATFEINLIFATDFRKILKLHKIPSNGSRVVPCGRTAGQPDRHDEANSFFSQSGERA